MSHYFLILRGEMKNQNIQITKDNLPNHTHIVSSEEDHNHNTILTSEYTAYTQYIGFSIWTLQLLIIIWFEISYICHLKNRKIIQMKTTV